jgi:hypothetical protein
MVSPWFVWSLINHDRTGRMCSVRGNTDDVIYFGVIPKQSHHDRR